MTALKQALDRLRTYAYLRDVHPTEWFEDFDKHNQGRITETQFRRAFEFMRYPWRPGEFEAVAEEFRTGDGTINYRQFCDALSKIFTNKDLEKDPTGEVKDSKKVVTRTLGKIQANTDPQFEALLAKMAHQVLTRGVHIRESYMDFDRHNSGNVTQSQFFRTMPLRDMSAAEMQLLVIGIRARRRSNEGKCKTTDRSQFTKSAKRTATRNEFAAHDVIASTKMARESTNTMKMPIALARQLTGS